MTPAPATPRIASPNGPTQQLTITPFADLNAFLTPKISRGRKPSRHQVRVTNGGNTPVEIEVSFQDPGGELTFEPRDWTATLQPGDTQDFLVRINGPRRWFGRAQLLPFSVVIDPAGPQPPIELSGTRRQIALFRWWISASVAISLVTAVITLYAALPKPTVPQVAGLMQSEAEIELRDHGYVVSATPIADPRPAGQVVKTDPAAGSQLARGQRVLMFVSMGPCNSVCQAKVPTTRGRTEEEARGVLRNAGFTVSQVIPAPSDLPAGIVTETSPAEQTEAPTNEPVVVFVSSGPLPSSPLGPPSAGTSGPPLPSPLGPPSPGATRSTPVILPPKPLPRPTPTPPPSTPPPSTPPVTRTCPPTSSADQPTTAGLDIASPRPGDPVGRANASHGTAHLAPGEHLWLLLCAPGIYRFYFTADAETQVFDNGAWHQQFTLDTSYPGEYFLYAVVVSSGDNQRLDQARINGGESPFVTELPHNARYFSVAVRCCS